MEHDPLFKALEGLEELNERVDTVERRMRDANADGSVEAMRRDLDGLLPEVLGLAKAVQGLQKEEQERDEGITWPWWWPGLSRSKTRAAWDLLLPFVDELRDRYPDSAGVDLRKCWFAHPQALDDLTAMYGVWQGAYLPDALPTAGAEWIDKYLPNTLRRVHDVTKGCRERCTVLGVRPKDVTDELRESWIDDVDLAGREADPDSV